MRKIIFSSLAVLISILGFVPSASAHVLQTDGSIGAVLHIDPDDDPIAGQTATFFFEVKDKTGKFQLEQCACTFTITRAGQQIFSQPLSTNNTFIFPAKDVYQVQISGTPLQANKFQAFKLTYDIRVEREAPSSTSAQPNWFSKHIIHFAGVIVIAIVVLIMIIKERFDKVKNSHS